MKKYLFISLFLLATAISVSAQDMVPVVAGEKGTLPTLPTVAPLAEGQFNGLELVMTTFYHNSYLDSYRKQVCLSFPDPTEVGGQSYMLQHREHGTSAWETLNEEITSSGYEFTVDKEFENTDYRLVLDNGDVSNMVTLLWPATNFFTKVTESYCGENSFISPGIAISSFDSFVTQTHLWGSDDAWSEYNIDDGYYRYAWYRCNPNNGAMTKINGANEITYTPTLSDCGYNMVLVVTGDDEHCSFEYRHDFGLVTFAVKANLVYIGSDGFVLTTDYVIPNSENAFQIAESSAEIENPEDFIGPLAPGIVEEQAEGRYAFHMPLDSYNYSIFNFNNPGYNLVFVYLVDWGDGPLEWVREVQIMGDRFLMPLNVTTTLNGAPVQAELEFYNYDIDNHPVLIMSRETDAQGALSLTEEDGLYGLGEGYIVKALATGSSEVTYYPSAMIWSEGTRVLPGYVGEDWETKAITIELLPKLPAISGKGTIEGTIAAVASGSHAPRRAAGYVSYDVMLRKVGADIVAQTATDASGHYSFKNIPYATYQVLVNVDGYMQEDVTQVTVSASNPTVDNVDYSVNDDCTITLPNAASPTAISTVGNAPVADYYTIDGQKLSGKPAFKGVYIRNNKKIIVH